MNEKAKSTLNKMDVYMSFEGYSKNTIGTYLSLCRRFLLSFNKDPYHINNNDVKQYLLKHRNKSNSYKNQLINSIKLFLERILKRQFENVEINRPRKEHKLPKLIDKDILLTKIDVIENIKHKTILTLILSTGMRVSEVINLKQSDLCSKSRKIFIRGAKGYKDRMVHMSEKVYYLIRDYYWSFKPKEYLFNGQNSLKYSTTSIRKLVKRHIRKDAYPHILRHAFATNLVENGVNQIALQSLMGHNSSKTCERYVHVSSIRINNLNYIC